MSENTDNYNPKAEIEKIERRFEHQNFAKDFCAAAESQKNIDEVLRLIIKQLIASDSEIRKRIEDIIDTYIKKDKWLTIKKSLTVIYAIVLLIIGAGLSSSAALEVATAHAHGDMSSSVERAKLCQRDDFHIVRQLHW